jgi:hypothetical protein
MTRESTISDKIKTAISKIPNSLIFRRNVGDFETKDGRYISIGVKGEADLQGFIGNQLCPYCDNPIHPLPVAVEVKSDAKYANQSKKQKSWQTNVWERRGVLYILAKSVDDINIAIETRLIKVGEIDMTDEFRGKVITKYLLEISPLVDGKNLMDCLIDTASKLNISLSSIHRWRRFGKVTTAEHAIAILLAINKTRESLGIPERCGIKDLAIICNFRDKYSKPGSVELSK